MEQCILIPSHRLRRADLDRFKENPFKDMIKFVVDVKQERIALGGEMHADGEEALLLSGSQQENLWGGNLWPWDQPPRIEYISLINIRPSVGNRAMDIQSEDLLHEVQRIVDLWVELG